MSRWNHKCCECDHWDPETSWCSKREEYINGREWTCRKFELEKDIDKEE